MEHLWLFGASRQGERALTRLRDTYPIMGFIDNDSRKQGTYFLELPVISLETFSKRHTDARVVICSQYIFEIMTQLLAFGIRDFSIFEIPHIPSATDKSISRFLLDCHFPEGLTVDQQGLALLIDNASGSNTYALAKRATLDMQGRAKCVYRGTSGWYQTYATFRNFVFTDGMIIPKNGCAMQLWHGFPLKGMNYMSRFYEQSHQHYWKDYVAIASYSTTYSSLMNACFGGRVEQYVITGMPRNDFLFCSDGQRVFEEVTGQSLVSRQLIAYMPTFRTTQFGQVNGKKHSCLFDFPDFDLEGLIHFLDYNNLLMLVKMHSYEQYEPVAMQRMVESEVFCWISDELLAAKQRDFYELLNAVDLLITDYSSVYFDYLLLDRPIIFTPTDVEQYRQSRGFLLEPYDFWAPGAKCLTQSEMLKQLERFLVHPQHHAGERDRVASIVHHFRDDQSSRRVAEMIMEHVQTDEHG